VSATAKTLYIRWARSGIGFPRRQRQAVRSLGLRRLQQVIKVPDTPQVRGLLARVPHLVEIVQLQSRASHTVPEYVIHPPERRPLDLPGGESRSALPVEAGEGSASPVASKKIEEPLESPAASEESDSRSASEAQVEETMEEPDQAGEK
jgi:large subunit ribosomal protein L30